MEPKQPHMKILHILLFILFPILLMAQANLNIQPGATLKLNGNPKLVIHNADFRNDGQFDPGTGQVTISGDQAGINEIGGSSYTDFYRLEILKPGGTVELIGTIDIENGIKMTKGFLDLNGETMVLKGLIAGENEDSRITGPNGGEIVMNQDLNMPNQINPGNMGIEISSTENLGNTWIIRGHQAMNSGSAPGIERFYEIVPENNINLDATIRLSYFDAELNGIPESSLVQYHGGFNQLVAYPNASADLNQNWIETTNIPIFEFITLADENPNPLPIELLDFKASVTPNQQVQLDWTTVTEINNDFFTLERSVDGIDFEDFAIVDGAGTSREILHYQYFDQSPYFGQSYYRLRQTDFDGTETKSEIQTVWIDQNEGIEVFPNPFQDQLNIRMIQEGEEPLQLNLFDAAGRLVRQDQFSSSQNQINWIGLDHLAAGNYLLEIRSDQQVSHFKLVKTE